MTRHWWNRQVARVRIVAGDPHNVKVTTTEDLELAEYLARRGT